MFATAIAFSFARVVSRYSFSAAEIHLASSGRSLISGNQIAINASDTMPSKKNSPRQLYWVTTQPEIGLVTAADNGRLIKNRPLARPSSFCGNHLPITTRTAG